MCHDDSDRLAADDERNVQSRVDAQAPCDLLVDLGIRSPADVGRRIEATVALLPRLWEAMEAILSARRAVGS